MYFELESMQLRHSIDAWSCDSHVELCHVQPSLVGEVLHTFLGTLGESFCIDCIGLIKIFSFDMNNQVWPLSKFYNVQCLFYDSQGCARLLLTV